MNELELKYGCNPNQKYSSQLPKAWAWTTCSSASWSNSSRVKSPQASAARRSLLPGLQKAQQLWMDLVRTLLANDAAWDSGFWSAGVRSPGPGCRRCSGRKFPCGGCRRYSPRSRLQRRSTKERGS